MRPKLKFHASKSSAHVGFPNSVCVRWGYIACSLLYVYRWVFALTFKWNWIDYSIGFSVSKEVDDESF